MKVFIYTVVVLVVLAAALGSVGWWWIGRQRAAANEATAVRVEPAVLGDLVEIVSAPGQVMPKEKVSISARVSARIAELPAERLFEECLPVRKGDLLVQLDSKDLKAFLDQATARRAAQEAQVTVSEARIVSQQQQIVAARVSLADAERDLQRQIALLASKDVSQAVVDTAQAKVDRLKAELQSALESLEADRKNLLVLKHNLDAAAADIARAEDNLSYATITAPIDGYITRLNAKVGEVVMTGTMNNAGTVILEVADLSRMLLVARVDETSVANVQVGQRATVRLPAYQDKTFEGTVHTVALANTEDRDGTKYFKVEVMLKTNGERIYSGLTGDVDIETKWHEHVIKVPSQAVLGRAVDILPAEVRDKPEVEKRKTMTPVVYRFLDGKAVVTPVKIGASDMMHTIIESGLTAGDKVIAGPYKVLEALQHDQKVKDDRVAAATTQPTTQPSTVVMK